MIGKRIKTLRELKGLYQEELGKRLGVSKQTVSNWESENITPAMDKFLALVEFFETTPNYLLGFDEERNLLDVSGLHEKEIRHIEMIIDDFRELHKKAKQNK